MSGSESSGWTYFQEMIFSSDLVGEQPEIDLVHRPEPAEAAEKAPPAEIHVDDPEVPVDAQQMDVVDPFDLGPGGIDDLLVQELVAKPDFVGPGFKRAERRFRPGGQADRPRVQPLDAGPLKLEYFFLPALPDGQADDRGVRFVQADLEVVQFPERSAPAEETTGRFRISEM